jgi:protein TonB
MTSPTHIRLALAVSVLLHLALLAARLPAPAPTPPMRLDVHLAVPEIEEKPLVPQALEPELFEKNTIVKEEAPKPLPQPVEPPKPSEQKRPARLKAAEEQHALRKLSEYILYPQTAVDAGHEGTVHLHLKLDASGNIQHVSVAAGSGHPELDHAALQAALRAGRLNAGGRSEIILPITFRLQ